MSLSREVDMITLSFWAYKTAYQTKASSKLARAALWRWPSWSFPVDTPKSLYPCVLNEYEPSFFPLTFYCKSREHHRVHLVENLEKFSELAGIIQSQAWKLGCTPFHPLSGPGALRAECKTLLQNCSLENLIISVVSWKNKECRAGLFLFASCFQMSGV